MANISKAFAAEPLSFRFFGFLCSYAGGVVSGTGIHMVGGR